MNSINRQILRLAIPAIVSNITIPLLGLCDTTIAGHLGNTIYLGAVAIGSMSINAIFWPLGFLRMGTTGLTAQAFGGKDLYQCHVIFTKALLLALLAGFVIIALKSPFQDTIVRFIADSDDVCIFATQYFGICVLAAPATLGTMAISGWFLGMQSSFYPMLIAVISNICNIIISCLLVYVVDMGFIGIAFGTFFSNWIGFFFALALTPRITHGRFPFSRIKDALRVKDSGKFFKVNGDIFFRSLFLMSVSMSVTAIGSRIGADTLAANAVMMQFFIMFSYFMDGFAFAAEALTGRSVGAFDYHLLRQTTVNIIKWGVAMVLIFTIIYALGANTISGFITNDSHVLSLVNKYKLCVILIPGIAVGAFIFDGFYIGMTATRRMLSATLCSAIIFFSINFINIRTANSPCVYLSLPDNNRLWIAFLAYLFCRGAILGVLYRSSARKAIPDKHKFVNP